MPKRSKRVYVEGTDQTVTLARDAFTTIANPFGPGIVTIWANGMISFGEPTNAQKAFMRSLDGGRSIYDFPGDFVAATFDPGFNAPGGDAVTVNFGFANVQPNPGDAFVQVFLINWGNDFPIRHQLQFTPDDIDIFDNDEGMSAFDVGGDADGPNHTASGTANDDVIATGWAKDVIQGLAGNDTLKGGQSDDRLEGGAGNDRLEGGAGTDIASYATASAAVNVSLLLEGQNTGGAGFDTLIDIEGLNGSAFNDTLIGNAGANSLSGGLGNDMIRGDAGNDMIDGGLGVDTLDYSRIGAGVSLNLLSRTPQDTGGAGIDAVRYIENIIGTAFADVLTGNEFANILTGGNGDDLLMGGLGNDTLNGGAGIDTVSFAKATAAVRVSLAITAAQSTLGAGVDTLSGIENLTGSAYDDSLTGNSANNVLTGNAGNDMLVGGLGNDLLSGGAGSDTIGYLGSTTGVTVDLRLTTAQNTIGAGTDTLASIENVTGSAFNDRLFGSLLANVISGGDGDDMIDGRIGSASDTIDGGRGNDTLFGGVGNDLLTGGIGNDSINGGNGIDTVVFAGAGSAVTVDLRIATAQAVGGGQGTDMIVNVENVVGSRFADVLTGSSAVNVLTGGAGKDVLTGAGGNDRFVYLATTDSMPGANADRITDFNPGDILDLSAIDANRNTPDTNDAFTRVGAFSGIAGQFTLAFSSASGVTTLLADTNGDRVADFSILFSGNVTATTSTWVL